MWQTEFIDENSLGEGNQLNQVRKVRGATCVWGERDGSPQGKGIVGVLLRATGQLGSTPPL